MKHLILIAATLTLATSADAAKRIGADAPERAADAMGRLVCKRFIRTGSLVSGYKECKSKREWEKERENLRQLNVSDSCRSRAEGGGC